MGESTVDIIINTRVTGDNSRKVASDLGDLKKEITETKNTMAGAQGASGNLIKSLKDLSSGSGGLKGAFEELKGKIPLMEIVTLGGAVMAAGKLAKDSIADYAGYVEQISKMATYTNTTTEEMSRLYQVTDDLRIPINSLETALKTMAEKGTAPSIEGLAKLSDEYLALQDPVERAKFLTDNFGRSGQEMAKMMALGGKAIRDQAKDIEDWMIVTGKSKKDIENYNKTMDAWDESIMRVKYNIGANLIPAITGFMKASMDSRDEIEKNGLGWTKWIPIVRGAIEVYYALKAAFGGGTTPEIPKVPSGPSYTPYSGSDSSYSYTSKRPTKAIGFGDLKGYRADGGPVEKGGIYKVGEREAEYLRIGMPGMVIPASAGGNMVIHLTYAPFISTLDKAEAERRLLPLIQGAMRNR